MAIKQGWVIGDSAFIPDVIFATEVTETYDPESGTSVFGTATHTASEIVDAYKNGFLCVLIDYFTQDDFRQTRILYLVNLSNDLDNDPPAFANTGTTLSVGIDGTVDYY